MLLCALRHVLRPPRYIPESVRPNIFFPFLEIRFKSHLSTIDLSRSFMPGILPARWKARHIFNVTICLYLHSV